LQVFLVSTASPSIVGIRTHMPDKVFLTVAWYYK